MVSFQHQKRWCIVGIYWDITGIHDHTWLAEKPPSKTGAEMGTSSINGLYIYIYLSYIFSIAMFDYQRTFFFGEESDLPNFTRTQPLSIPNRTTTGKSPAKTYFQEENFAGRSSSYLPNLAKPSCRNFLKFPGPFSVCGMGISEVRFPSYDIWSSLCTPARFRFSTLPQLW